MHVHTSESESDSLDHLAHDNVESFYANAKNSNVGG